MITRAMTIDAIYEGGLLKLEKPLPLPDHQKVTVTVQVASKVTDWPADAAAIYEEIAEEDRRLAAQMWQTVKETWPRDGAGQQ